MVHFNHLNHLSLGLPALAKARGINTVFTLHDFWLLCLRGQFLQDGQVNNNEVLPLCDGQEHTKCAKKCFTGFSTGLESAAGTDSAYWTNCVNQRQEAIAEMCRNVDTFIAPSHHLLQAFEENLPLPNMHMLRYGFDLKRYENRRRVEGEPFTLGYIGRVIPAKGLHQLVSAFDQLVQSTPSHETLPLLRIWGQVSKQDENRLLQLSDSAQSRISFEGPYENSEIVSAVFNRCDAIVVPSIWSENSPLVIQEANQARVPVITADHGGMSELVEDGVNGLTFRFRDVSSMAQVLSKALSNPKQLSELGERGFLHSDDGQVVSLKEHVDSVLHLYRPKLPNPWRVTFDTNPDTCNFNCVMCEQHAKDGHFYQERVVCFKNRTKFNVY